MVTNTPGALDPFDTTNPVAPIAVTAEAFALLRFRCNKTKQTNKQQQLVAFTSDAPGLLEMSY